jgi:hypothetical protein
VIGKLVDATIGPLEQRIEASVQKLLFAEVGQLALGGPPTDLKLDTAAIRSHGDAIKREADANVNGGRDLDNKVGGLTFTT